jgi:hypothetical protein
MRKMSIKSQPRQALCMSLRRWDEEGEFQEPILAGLLHGVRSWDEKDQGQSLASKCSISP